MMPSFSILKITENDMARKNPIAIGASKPGGIVSVSPQGDTAIPRRSAGLTPSCPSASPPLSTAIAYLTAYLRHLALMAQRGL